MKTTDAQIAKKQISPRAYRNFSWLTNRERVWLVAGLAILGGVFFPGCSTGKPASASFASVVIPNQSIEAIQATTKLVFEEAGYRAVRAPGGTTVFEMEGSRGDQILYGGLGGAAYGASVTMRVKTEIIDLVGQDARRLQCQAFVVRNAGGGLFEDAQRLANFRGKPYQKLLAL